MTDAEKAAVNEVNNNIAALKTQIENGATKEELTNSINDLAEKMVKAEDVTSLKTALESLKDSFTELKEKGGMDTQKEGVLSKFFVENAERFEEKNKQYDAAFTIKAPALMSTANITPVTTDGFSPLFNNYIDTEVGRTPKPDTFVLDMVDVRVQKGTEKIYYSDRVNEEGDAQFIAEGSLKPLVDAEYVSQSKNIKEVSLRWKFTKRLMNHAPSVEADFKEHAQELIEQKMDDAALIGDETVNSDEFDGIATLAAPFIVPPSLANFYSECNIWDVINAVATYVRLNNFKGNLKCVLNTVWKAKMQGYKTSEGEYIIPPFVTADGKQVGEVSVEFRNKMPESHILLGDMMRYKIVIAEDVEYDEGYENDDFSKNLVSRKLEAFMGSYIKGSDAGSIIYDEIATIKTLIEEPVV